MPKTKTGSRSEQRGSVSAEKRGMLFPILLALASAVLSVPTLLLPPEGNVRGGDAFTLVFGWLLLAGGAIVLRACLPPRKMRAADICAALLFGWPALSYFGLSHSRSGNLLYAANGFWAFALMPIVYFVFRALPSKTNRLLEQLFFAVLLGAAFFEAGYSLYSYHVTAPRLREEFRADPEAVLAQSGLNIKKGSPEYLLFEKRVLNSTEPIGTYGLTNTLAGTLVPVLLLAAVLLAASWFSPQEEDPRFQPGPKKRRIPIRIAASLLVILLSYTLLLTKSRAGYLSLLFCILAVFGVFLFTGGAAARKEPRRNWRKASLFAGLTVLGFALIAAAAFRCGVLDREVFSEAKKSLGYRLDYWQAASRMIADHPLLGIGPGNFQPVYTRYILPDAAESIADPHNFAFEYAALFGIPALVLFLLFLAFTAAGLRKTSSPPASREETFQETGSGEKVPYIPVFVVYLAGYFLYAVFNFLSSAPTGAGILLGFAPVFLAFSLAAAPLAANIARLPSPFLFAAAGAGLLNLCAAGGIGYPPTAVPLWGLAAILTNRACEKSVIRETSPAKKKISLAAAGFAYVCFFLLFLRGAFFPVLTEKTLLPRLGELTPDRAAEQLVAAANGSGRHSIPILWAVSDMALYRLADLPSPQREKDWLAAKDRLIANAPGMASLHSDMGDVEFSLYGTTQNRLFLAEASRSLKKAAEFFPTDALLHARYAIVLHASGDFDGARREKAEALRLDALTPHEDRKIPESVKSLLTAIGENR